MKTFTAKAKGLKLKITAHSKKWVKSYLKKDYANYKFKIKVLK